MNDVSKKLLKYKGDKLTFEQIEKLNFGYICIMKYKDSEKDRR